MKDMQYPCSRRRFLAVSAQSIAALVVLSGCTLVTAEAPTPAAVMPPTMTTEPTPEVPEVSLDVKIGQMLMVGFQGSELAADHPILRDIRAQHLGGVILLDWADNIQSPEQVQSLVAALQSAASIPLLVSVDYEGGVVTRLEERLGFPATESHQELGQTNDLSVTHAQATTMAETLAQLGVNLNLAPVVDLNSNPANPIIARYQRSFSDDPAVVSDHALTFIAAHHEHGILCVLKHFPGHGSSTADSHVGLTDITGTWSPAELEPYRAIIRAGQADAIMTAHVFHTDIDTDYPATLSRAAITGLLREELGYAGVVISDDMNMGAIRNYYGFETAIQQAIAAGVDILLFADPDPTLTTRAAAVIRQSLVNGTISPERIDASYRRIYRLKRRLGWSGAIPTDAVPVVTPAVQPAAQPEQQQDARFFAETGQTVRGPFLEFWRRHGGLQQFGYPLTGEREEHGQTVQYFERARLEYHPEHAGTGHAIQIAPLGSILTEHRRHEPPFQEATPGTQPGPFIEQTGHHIGLKFLDHWEQQQGAFIYGYPISEPFREQSPVDGQSYLVQYFERARLEYHPEHADTEQEILLGRLGEEALQSRPDRR